MSEFLNGREDRATIRRQLLATACIVALLGIGTAQTRAEDRPIIWIELDGQFSQQETGADPYIPAFLPMSPFDAIKHVGLENGPQTIWDEGAQLSFQPEESDWILSLGVRYGKNNRSAVRDEHPPSPTKYAGPLSRYNAYQNLTAQSSESHIILDFRAGKDFGLGMFGSGGSSVFSFGVRYAQFSSRSDVTIKSQPTNVSDYYPYNKFQASFAAKRRFSGVGPSISWDSSARLFGNPSAGNIALDWGLNGALLFGRQTVRGHHQTTAYHHYCLYYCFRIKTTYQHSAPISRSRQVMVPNLGGFAGLSWRYPNAKVSIGYRADMFFGAIDGGIDAAHRESRGFYGPFASVSVGIGG